MKKFNFKVDLSYDPSTGNIIDNTTNKVVSKADNITVEFLNNYVAKKASKDVSEYKHSARQQKVSNTPNLRLTDPEAIIKEHYGKLKSWAPKNNRLFRRVVRYATLIKPGSTQDPIDLNFIDTKYIKDMSRLFFMTGSKGCSDNVDVSSWDVSNVTNMSDMFAHSTFNGDISNWDVSNVTDMSTMFATSKFNGDISKWDVSKVRNMSQMFDYSEFNQDISNWDVSNVKSMSYMFLRSRFNGNISNWDVSNVISMSGMFSSSVFNKNISKWNVSNVTEMDAMFSSAAFNGDISNWDVSNVKHMYAMFENSKFRGDISNWDVSNVISARDMFVGYDEEDIPSWYDDIAEGRSVKESTSLKNTLAKVRERSAFSRDLHSIMHD